MLEKNNAGRPIRGTISLDEVILRRLRIGPATWKELKDAMPEGSARNDSSLKKGLDRLIDSLMIMPEAILIDGKAKTVYKLVKPHGVMLDFYEENFPLYSWVGKTYTELFEKRLLWARDNHKKGKQELSGKSRGSEKISAEIIEKQGEAIAVALRGLAEETLDFIKTSYLLNEGCEPKRRIYFENAWETYLSVIAVEISGLASPECGNTMQAIEIAKEKLKKNI